MADESGTVDRVVQELVFALQPLEDRLAVGQIDTFFAELGLQFPPEIKNQAAFTKALGDCLSSIAGLPPLVTKLIAAIESQGDNTGQIISAVADLVVDVAKFASAADATAKELAAIANQPGMPADAAAFAGELVERLIGYSLIDYLAAYYPLLLSVLALLGIVEMSSEQVDSVDPTHPPYFKRALRLEAIADILKSPLDFLKAEYGWGDPKFDGKLLLERIEDLLLALGVTSLPLTLDDDGNTTLQLLAVSIHAARKANPPGLQATIDEKLEEDLKLDIPLSDSVKVELEVKGGLEGGVGVLLQPPAKLSLLPVKASIDGEAWLRLIAASSDPKQALQLFGSTGGSRLEAKTITVSAGGGFKWNVAANQAQGDVAFEAKFEDGKVVIDTSNGDGFLAKILPKDGIAFDFGFDVGWSSDKGFFFKGGAGFEVALALNQSLGPIELDTIHLLLAIANAGLHVEVSLDCGATLGPLAVAVERIGVAIDLNFKRGNLGPADLGIGFKFPTGLGLEIDAGPISGGGFISFDPDNGRYAGILQLKCYSVSITVIGLLDTILPGGEHGFSFLLIVAVEFSPIQLGFGITLNGIGGLAGINRNMVTEALRAGLRAHKLNEILFPKDPLQHAAQLISDIRAIFPPAEGRYVFGPMLEFGWATFVKAELGLILSVPSPVVIAILGSISAIFPDEDAAVLVLHLDVLGIIDFGEKLFSLDATIYDSRIVIFALSGDMAMRLSWGDNPSFLFSIGGFNPHFQPPAGFRPLKRLTLSVDYGDYVHFALELYFAVTSNSFQFGTHLDLLIHVSDFRIHGWLGFDALFIFKPFSFIIDFTAGFEIAWGDMVLAGISLSAELSGPTPWHIKGDASISLLFFSISVHVDKTFGDESHDQLPDIDPWPQLQAAVQDLRNWTAALPPSAQQVVGLAAPEGKSAPFLLDPLGVVTMKQKVVPLNQKLTKFGENQVVGGGQTYALDPGDVRVGGQQVTFQVVNDHFAPAKFREMSDADKVSGPSFVDMPAGFSLSDAKDVAAGTGVQATINYVTTEVDPDGTPKRLPGRYPLLLDHQLAMITRGAAARSTLRKSGERKFAPDARRDRLVTLSQELYVVETVKDNKVRNDITKPVSQGLAQKALAEYLADHPEEKSDLQVMPVNDPDRDVGAAA